jgi:hypothetical protein
MVNAASRLEVPKRIKATMNELKLEYMSITDIDHHGLID